MGGFNLPPGCDVSDIPGNRPEDAAAEAFEEALCSRFEDVEKLLHSTSGVDQLLYNLFVKVADWAYGQGNGVGYTDGKADQGYADDVEETAAVNKRAQRIFNAEVHIGTLITINGLCWKEEIEGGAIPDMKPVLRQIEDHLDNLKELIKELGDDG